MTRGHGMRGCIATIAWIVAASLAQAGDLGQWAGCGYGSGYNTPAGCKGGCANGCNKACHKICGNGYGNSGGGCGNGCNNNSGELNPFGWIRGCCEIPGTWRQNVWDGYHGDACTYRWSFVGAQPEYAHAPLMNNYPQSQNCLTGNCGTTGYGAPNVSGYPLNPTTGNTGGYILPNASQAPGPGPELEPGVPGPAP